MKIELYVENQLAGSKQCLNPYSNGMKIEQLCGYIHLELLFVLILILME